MDQLQQDTNSNQPIIRELTKKNELFEQLLKKITQRTGKSEYEIALAVNRTSGYIAQLRCKMKKGKEVSVKFLDLLTLHFAKELKGQTKEEKSNCEYFPHFSSMRNHRKIKAIRAKFGMNGYGIWIMFLEYLTQADGNEFYNSDLEYELIAGDFGVSVTEIRDVIDYCITLELLTVKNGFIRKGSLDEIMLTDNTFKS